MRKTVLILACLLAIGLADSAAACESCAQYFDYQTLNWCKYCRYTYCGYFGCVVRSDIGFQYCDSTWDVEGDDQCFTAEGNDKGMCGPSPMTEVLPSVAAPEWRLVRSRVVSMQKS